MVLSVGKRDELSPPEHAEWLETRLPKDWLKAVFWSDRDHGEVIQMFYGEYREQFVAYLDKYNPIPEEELEDPSFLQYSFE
jgi:hypothetical protein